MSAVSVPGVPASALDEWQKLCDDLEHRSSELDKRSADLKRARAAFEAEKETWETSHAAAAVEQEDAVAALEQAHTVLAAEQAKFSKEMVDLAASKEAVASQRRIMQAEYEAQMERLETIKAELDAQESAIDSESALAASVKGTVLEELEQEEAALRSSVDELRQEIITLSGKRDGLVEEVTSGELELERLTNSVTEMMAMKTDIETVDELVERRTELEVEVDELQTMRDETVVELEELQAHYQHIHMMGQQQQQQQQQQNQGGSSSALADGGGSESAMSAAARESISFDLKMLADKREALMTEVSRLEDHFRVLQRSAAATAADAEPVDHAGNLHPATPMGPPPDDATGTTTTTTPGLRVAVPDMHGAGSSPSLIQSAVSTDSPTFAPVAPYFASDAANGHSGKGEVHRRRQELMKHVGSKPKTLVGRLWKKLGPKTTWQPNKETWFPKWRVAWEHLTPWEVVSGNSSRDCLTPSDAATFSDSLPLGPPLPPILPTHARPNSHNLFDEEQRLSHFREGGPASVHGQHKPAQVAPSRSTAIQPHPPASPTLRTQTGGSPTPSADSVVDSHGGWVEPASTVPYVSFATTTDPPPVFSSVMHQPEAHRMDELRRTLGSVRTQRVPQVAWDSVAHPCRAVVRRAWTSPPGDSPARDYALLLLDLLILGVATTAHGDFQFKPTHVVRLDRVTAVSELQTGDKNEEDDDDDEYGPMYALGLELEDGSPTVVVRLESQPMLSGWLTDLRRCVQFAKQGSTNLPVVFRSMGAFKFSASLVAVPATSEFTGSVGHDGDDDRHSRMSASTTSVSGSNRHLTGAYGSGAHTGAPPVTMEVMEAESQVSAGGGARVPSPVPVSAPEPPVPGPAPAPATIPVGSVAPAPAPTRSWPASKPAGFVDDGDDDLEALWAQYSRPAQPAPAAMTPGAASASVSGSPRSTSFLSKVPASLRTSGR